MSAYMMCVVNICSHGRTAENGTKKKSNEYDIVNCIISFMHVSSTLSWQNSTLNFRLADETYIVNVLLVLSSSSFG